MSEILNDLNNEYKQKRKEADTLAEKQQIRHDYKEIKQIIKEAEQSEKKNNRDKSSDKFWAKFDSPIIDDYKVNDFKIKNDKTLKDMDNKIEKNKKQFEELKRSGDEMEQKTNEIIKEIDEKLAEIEKNEADESTISDEQIKTTITEIAGTDNMDNNKLLFKLIKSIINMPVNIETTIAQLLGIGNDIVATVDPLLQGEISYLLMTACKKLNINIYENYDEIGGLGYHYKFKKIDSVIKKEYTQEELKELFYRTMNEAEVSKLNELGMNEEIVKLNTPTHQVKYFDNVGYVLIGDGYIIQENGMEQQRYFATIVSSPEEAKQEILKKLNS